MSLDLGKIGYKVFIDDREYRTILKRMEAEANGSSQRIGGIFTKLAGYLGVGVLFWKSMTGARAFSKELANLQSIADDLDMSKVRTEILNLDARLGSSAELTNALYYAYSAGVRGTEAELVKFTGQVAQLAQTVGSGITPIMDALTTMMNAYGLTVKDTGKLTDWFYSIVKAGKTTGPELAQSLGQIAATAAGSGIKIEELGAALATLTTTMPTNIAVTSLAASIRTLLNPTDETRKAAEALGLDMSAAAIRAKGFGAVMQEIHDKTQGKADIIAKLFPAESSRAIMSLAGTQIKMLNDNIVTFGANAGAAEKGFSAIAASDAKKWDAMLVVAQKLGTVFGDMAFKLLTLGGALNGVYDWIYKLNASSIQTIAKIGAMTAGMFALGKIIDMVRKGSAVFLALSVKGGYQTNQMKEAEQHANAEKKKALTTEVYNAARIVSEKRRHLAEMTNIARSTAAVLSSEQAKYKAALANGPLTIAQTRAYERSISAAQRAHDAAVRNAHQASIAYDNARTGARTATIALNAHNASARAGVATIGLMRGAWNSFTAAVAANPIGFVLTAITIAISGIMYLIDRANAKMQEAVDTAVEGSRKAQETFDKGEENRKTDKTEIDRLEELSKAQKLSSAEQKEAQNIIDRLEKTYKDFGVSVDSTTGKINHQANSFELLTEKMKNARIEEARQVAQRKNTELEEKRKKFVYDEMGGTTGKVARAGSVIATFGLYNPTGKEYDEREQNWNELTKNPRLIRELLKSKDLDPKKRNRLQDLLTAYDEKSKADEMFSGAKAGKPSKEDEEKNRNRLQEAESSGTRIMDKWKDADLTDNDRRRKQIEREYEEYKKTLDVRKELGAIDDREYSRLDKEAQAFRDLQIKENEIDRQNTLNMLKEQEKAYADGILSDEEKLSLKKAEILAQQMKITELERQLKIQQSPEKKAKLELDLAKARAGVGQSQGEYNQMKDDKKYSDAEQKRNIQYEEKKADLMKSEESKGMSEEERKRALQEKDREIAEQKKRVKEAEKKQAKASTPEEAKKATKNLTKEREKENTLKKEREEIAKPKAAPEQNDGYLTEANKIKLKQLEIDQQSQRIAELEQRRSEAKTDELRQQLTLQIAQARSKKSQLEFEAKQMKEDKASKDAEDKRSKEMLELQNKNREDGVLTSEEKRAELQLQIDQQKQRVQEMTKKAAGETNVDLKKQSEMAVLQARNALSNLLVEQNKLQDRTTSQGSFSASVLSMMNENPVDKQQLEKLRQIEKNTKDNKLKYK